MQKTEDVQRLNLAYKHAFESEAGQVVLAHLRRRFLQNALAVPQGVTAGEKALLDAGAKSVVLEIDNRIKAAQEVLVQS